MMVRDWSIAKDSGSPPCQGSIVAGVGPPQAGRRMPQSQRKPSGSPVAWLARSNPQLHSRPAMHATSPADSAAQAGSSAREGAAPATKASAAKPTDQLQVENTGT